MVAYLATMVFAFTSAFSTSYVMFCIMRFFTGVTLSGISIISIVLSELVPDCALYCIVLYILKCYTGSLAIKSIVPVTERSLVKIPEPTK
jgi:MFS family permease